MTSELLQYVNKLFNDDVVNTTTTNTGESNGNIRTALAAIIPTVLGGIFRKATSDQQAGQQIMDDALRADSDNLWGNLTNVNNNSSLLDRGANFIQDIFGGSAVVDRLTNNVATHSSVKKASASMLLRMAAPLILSAIGRYISQKGLNLNSLLSLFNKEKAAVTSAMPAGWTIADNNADTSNTMHPGNERVESKTDYVTEQKKSNIWLPLLLLILLAGVLWWAMKSCNKNPEADTVIVNDTMVDAEPATTTTTTTTTSTALPSWKWNEDSTVSYELGAMRMEKLPDGTEIEIAENGAEMALIEKIKMAISNGVDSTVEGKKAGWVNLYDIQFTKGTTYRDGAAKQIANIAAILKAYPQVHIKLGGYTDNTGSDDINKSLSQKRADKVMADVAAKGVRAQLDKAEGYGAEFPIADNSTAEGRAQNRRVSARVTSVQ